MKDPIFRRMFSYDRNLLPNRHLASLETGVNTIEAAQRLTGLTIGYPGWGLIYYLLLSHLDRSRHETIIETGTNRGCTTIVLAQALVDAGCTGKVLSFELDGANVEMARKNVAEAGLSEFVEIFQGNTRDTLESVLSDVNDCRFAFLDASHLEEDVLFEFRTVTRATTPDALIVFDNTYRIAEDGEDQRVNGFLRKVLGAEEGNLINLEHVSWYTPGLAIWQRQPDLGQA